MSRESKKDKELKKLDAETLVDLKRQLNVVRQRSLEGTRQGDYRRVARATAEAAELSRSIAELEGIILAAGGLLDDDPAP